MKIRKWDTVEIIAGKTQDKGVKAEVLKVFIAESKILVKGVNVVTRHMRKMWTQPWQIVKMEKPIDASNAMLVCPITQKKTRVGYVSIEEKWNTKKYRFSKVAAKEGKKAAKDCIIK